MNDPVICLSNLMGRILGIKRVEFDGLELRVVKHNTTMRYPLETIAADADLRISWMGGAFNLNTLKHPLHIRFLDKSVIVQLIETLQQAVSEKATKKIDAVYRHIVSSGIDQYLRDSHVMAIDEQLQRTVTLYKPLLASSHRISKATSEALSMLASVTPLHLHKARLRNEFETKQLRARETFFSRVESNPLTEPQRLAVMRNNDRNLVLAAAGTGKTSVIVAKALNLIQADNVLPRDILILAYNKAAAEELKARITARASTLGGDDKRLPKIKTFHGLGRQILLNANIIPTMSRFVEDKTALEVWATQWFEEKLKQSDHSLKMFVRLLYPPINPFSFETMEEYENYVRDNEYRTLNGEKVRGYQELLIANWLYLNCVEYEYEPSYVTKRRLSVGFDYRPDFYLTDADIYLEHFGIDRQGNTRPNIDSLRYQEEMTAKRALHKEQNTRLIETFHYQWVEHNLERALETQLTALDVPLASRSSEEIFAALKEFGGISEGVSRYINCLKAIRVEQLTMEDIATRLNAHEIGNAEDYADLLTSFHNAYIDELMIESAIDYDDMIIRATECISESRYAPHFTHILVDEFQDISMARMNFLSALIEKGPAPILTAVGDDWQSIYRFSGGKLELTTRFEELVGSHTKTMLDKTFRYNNSIAHTAGTFVMANPEQYKKHIHTHKEVETPQVFLLDDFVNETPDLPQKTRQIIERILSHNPKASIAILARYRHLLNEAKTALTRIEGQHDIKFWTLHGSKGLEADYCIVIGLTHGKLGFPSSRKDEIVVEALLPSLDPYPFSEERRLLYVAITRAKEKCYLVADPTAPSPFVKELLKPELEVLVASDLLTGQYANHYKCPHCSNGYLKKMTGQYGEFYTCSTNTACRINIRVCKVCNGPSVDGETSSLCLNSSCAIELELCPRCGRPLKRVHGKYSDFWGCTGFGIPKDSCTYKRSLKASK
ncbi:UvrD-helicase domain-containing protein [Alteromonas stellipolaris]|uniref:UvrD-helicase domain-containing protein n=1 Tax=Alteromonas stellipolaris TaxID=233316 RepID=UPI0026E39DC5|nr:UvrD-helicase domain-containing protein [Alteromonas stellipolaris]MDO6536259.1 UvrD-helicase domain-containing protein [Alteromonas stellipolaris]MDO6627794.1 UvrD-helicase domain-containing protein [Alteromonas stellipolaris]